MANRYWVGGSGTWSASSNYALGITTNWSETSGGPSGASIPTQDDDVFFDSNSSSGSYNLTLAAGQIMTCRSLTMNNPATGTLNLKGAIPQVRPTIRIYGSLYVGNIGLPNNSGEQYGLEFLSTNTGNTIYIADGLSKYFPIYGGITFNGIGGEWTLLSNWNHYGNYGDGYFALLAGTLNLNGFTLQTDYSYSSGSLARTLNLTNSTFYCHSYNISSTNCNIITTGSTLIVDGFTGGTNVTLGGFSYATVNLSGVARTISDSSTITNLNTSAALTISASNTISNLTVSAGLLTLSATQNIGTLNLQNTSNGYYGTRLAVSATQNIGTLNTTAGTPVNRTRIASSTIGTPVTLNISTATGLTDCDFRDINVTGSVSPISGTRLGDLRGNTGITFTSKTVYWNLTGTAQLDWTSTAWCSTSGGTPDINNFPLPQDTAVFDNASALPTSKINITRTNAVRINLPGIDMSAKTAYFRIQLYPDPQAGGEGGSANIYGDLIYGTTNNIDSNSLEQVILYFAGRKTQNIQTNGVTPSIKFSIDSPGGTVKLLDNLTTNTDTGNGAWPDFALSNGTLDLNGKILTYQAPGFGIFTISSGTSNITFNGGTLVINAPNFSNSSANFTTTEGSGPGTISMIRTIAKTFAGGGTTYNCTLDQGGAGTLTVTGSNYFKNVTNTYSSTGATTLTFTGGTTTRLTDFSAVGTVGKVLTLNSTTTTNAVLRVQNRPSTLDYIAASYITADYAPLYLTTNSTVSNSTNVFATSYVAPFDHYWVARGGTWGPNSLVNNQNNTFLDSSTNNFTITRNGDTTQGSFNPYIPTGYWSAYFDGTGDFLTIPRSTAFLPAANTDFTVEAWIYVTAVPGAQGGQIVGLHEYGTSSDWLLGINSSMQVGIYLNSVITTYTNTTTIPLNTWTHVAASRSGTGSNNLKVFVNGVGQSFTTNATMVGNGSNVLSIGADQNGDEALYTGYISNLRFVNGTGLYTSDFTPSNTPITAVTNTSLLCLQDNRFKDNSTNNFAITRNGDTRISKLAPFNPPASYSTASYGGSGYFDGTGDYLTAPDNAAFDFGGGDFTVEMWYYPTSIPAATVLVSKWNAGGSPTSNQWLLFLNSAAVEAAISTDGTNISSTITGPNVRLNQWNHVAFVRNGNSFTVYANGVGGTSVTNSGTLYALDTEVLGIGYRRNNGAAFEPMFGYASQVRIVKGTAVYTGNFTPPTTPLTAITNTSLLLNFTNAGIYDATTLNDVQTVGDAQASNVQKKYGIASMSLDGTTDYIVSPSTTSFGYGTGDFTIEFWLYLNNVTTDQTIFSNLTSATSVNPHLYFANTNDTIRYYTGSVDRITSGAVVANQWYHIALTKASGSTRLFINGTQAGSTYVDANNYGNSAPLGIGAYWASGAPVVGNNLNGYVQDLRITTGVARYTANFTAPTSELSLDGDANAKNVVLLLKTRTDLTTPWSNTSGGAPGSAAPFYDENVIFDTGSSPSAYTLSMSGTVGCKSLTIGNPASGTTTLAAAGSTVQIYGNLTLANLTVSSGPSTINFLSFKSSNTITSSAASALNTGVVFDGIENIWTLGSALNLGTGGLTLTAGSLVANGYTISTQAFSSTSPTFSRTLNLTNSTLTCGYTYNVDSTLNLITTGSTIGISVVFGSSNFGGKTYGTVNLTGQNGGTQTVEGSNSTFNNLNINPNNCTLTFNGSNTVTNNFTVYNSAGTLTVSGTHNIGGNLILHRLTGGSNPTIIFGANQNITGGITHITEFAGGGRFTITSNTIGTPVTVSIGTASSLSSVWFRDIVVQGAGAPIIGSDLGDYKGNSGITFDAPRTLYYVGGTAAFNSATGWANSSGGSSLGVNIRPQDTAIFDNNSNGGADFTMTVSGFIGSINLYSRNVLPMTLNVSGNTTVYGDWAHSSSVVGSVTITGSGSLTFAGRNTQTITSMGKTFTQPLIIDSPGGTVQLADALITTGALTVTKGTFNAQTYNVTAASLSSSNSNTRSLNLGSGTWTLTGTGTVWDLATVTGLTFNKGTANIILSNISTTARTFAGGSLTYNDLTIGGTTGTSTTTITGSNTFSTLSSTKTVAHTITFGASSVTNFTTWGINGSFGNTVTINSTSAGTRASLIKANSTLSNLRSFNIRDTLVSPSSTWYATDSTNTGNNSGWIFNNSKFLGTFL